MIIKRRGVFPETLESETMNTQSIYNGLDYTTKEINHNFKIKVNGIVNGKKVNVLVGVSGLIKIVGDIKLVNRLLKRAFIVTATKRFANCAEALKSLSIISKQRPGVFRATNKFPRNENRFKRRKPMPKRNRELRNVLYDDWT